MPSLADLFTSEAGAFVRQEEEEEEEEEEETSQLFVYKTENVNIPERRKCSWKWQTLITKADYLQKWRRSKWECQTLIMVLKKLKNIKNALKWLPIVLIHAPIYKSKRNLCWGLWSLGENGLKMLKAPSGYIMVISWLFHGYIMVTSWSCQSWLYHGFILVTYIRVISWLYHWMFWFRRSH